MSGLSFTLVALNSDHVTHVMCDECSIDEGSNPDDGLRKFARMLPLPLFTEAFFRALNEHLQTEHANKDGFEMKFTFATAKKLS